MDDDPSLDVARLADVPEQIDELDPKWHLKVPARAQFDLLPGHPWIWRNDLERTGEVVAGALWKVCADLVAEPIDDERPVVAAIAPRSIIRRHRRPVESGDVPRLSRSRRPLILIPSGIELPAVSVIHWGDDSPGSVAGQSIELALPDGRSVWIVAEALQQARNAAGGIAEALTWRELACAAVVLPTLHPLASNPAACAALVDRIERRAADAYRAYCLESAV